MWQNEGMWDRVVRVVLGLGLLAYFFASGHVWALIGLVPLATGAVGFCPLYKLIGFSTGKRQSTS